MTDLAHLFRLDGKAAVITGSTRGIGLATARLFAQAGATVVISSRKPDACEAVRAQFEEEGLAAIAVPCHVGEDDQRRRLAAEVMERLGRVDILVTNAGANPVFSTLQNLTEEAWEKAIDINLKAAWRLGQLFLPIIADQGGGSMVVLSSTSSVAPTLTSGAYAVAKIGLNHLARQLAIEWGPKGINVNSVAPGMTRTDMVRSAVARYADTLRKAVERTPLRRMAEPEDIAATVLFLCSAGRHMTGQTLVVDGGSTLSAGR